MTRYLTYQRLARLYCYILLAVMAFFFYHTTKLSYGAVYTQAIIVLVVILDLFVIFYSFQEEKKKDITEQKANYEKILTKQSVIVIAAPIFNYISWRYLYFVGGSFTTMLILFLVQKVNPVKSVLVAVITAVVLQLLFYNGFKVWLPTPGWWPDF